MASQEPGPAIDISVNIHLPEEPHRWLPLGVYRPLVPPGWRKSVPDGPEFMVEMMRRSNVQLSLVISLWCANGVGGEELYIAARKRRLCPQPTPQTSWAWWAFAAPGMG